MKKVAYVLQEAHIHAFVQSLTQQYLLNLYEAGIVQGAGDSSVSETNNHKNWLVAIELSAVKENYMILWKFLTWGPKLFQKGSGGLP